MRVSIVEEAKLIHVFIEDEACSRSLEIVQDQETKEIFMKTGEQIINIFYEEDFRKLTLSDFYYDLCLYNVYKKFLKLIDTFPS